MLFRGFESDAQRRVWVRGEVLKPLLIKLVLLLIAAWLLFPMVSYGDRIILKDGTIEESERVWESDNFIHFILKGTEAVEIRFTKEIVERIERENSVQKRPDESPLRSSEKTADADSTAANHGQEEIKPAENALNGNGAEEANLRKIAGECKGIPFYDPRRSRRYWASKASQHGDLQSALIALAHLYGRAPEWVEAYMGGENDLEGIHLNLLRRRIVETDSQNQGTWKHLQQQGGSSAHHMESDLSAGPTSHLKEADQNAEAGEEHLTKPATSAVEERAREFPEFEIGQDTKFYDPRRDAKYWTSQMAHHNSLHEAIDALATQYGVSPEWIENHMGATNVLVEIHRNIRSSLTHGR